MKATERQNYFWDDEKKMYFKYISGEVPDEELKQYIDIKVSNMIEDIRNDINTIKSIIICSIVIGCLVAIYWFYVTSSHKY